MNNFTIVDKCISLIAKRCSGKSVLLKHCAATTISKDRNCNNGKKYFSTQSTKNNNHWDGPDY